MENDIWKILCSWLRHDSPVVIRCSGYYLVELDPVDNQLPNFLARSIDYWSTLVHRVATTSIDTIVVGCETKLLLSLDWLAAEAKILNSLTERLGDVEIVGDSFGNIEVVSGNLFIN